MKDGCEYLDKEADLFCTATEFADEYGVAKMLRVITEVIDRRELELVEKYENLSRCR